MANQELVAYLQRQVEQNLPKEKVREKLISAGWKNEEINEGLLEVSRQSIKTKGVINQDIKNLETLFAPLKIVESDLSNVIKEKPFFTLKKRVISSWTIFLLVLLLIIIFAILYIYFPTLAIFSIFAKPV